jgi:spore coat polysaccharide biosynthesis predicted glycosyltransferase SpsG
MATDALSALAEEMVAKGFECVFVGSLGGIDWIKSRLSEIGLAIYADIPDRIRMDSADYTLILDSYDSLVHAKILNGIPWNKVVSIADQQTPILRADLVVHPGLEGEWFEGDSSKFLYGGKYVLLRNSINRSKKIVGSNLKEIVVFGGGTDTFGFGAAVSKLLSELDGFEHVSVFGNLQGPTGVFNDSRFEEVPLGGNLDFRIKDADLVLTSASTSSLEIVARGIPLGVARIVDNQEVYYKALGAAGLAAQIGYLDNDRSWSFDRGVIKRLIVDSSYRKDLVMATEGAIDFEGASRVLEAIVALD